ncbi:hypothetical protein U5801_02490 [Lamprobacter modestohalophilus]|uniref:hypothetical protein n=1 Tax=Lamprobacter modestohalophilus TaxID=1064514 RepID=UPI002ADECA34|nr:hypothetical protein [Lamprobacter modestohalophilus]MEA1048693.1 hypothetical protein [Lamprobacter modestohalophilus]
MKPDTRTAMHELIAEVRETLPFDAPATQVCGGDCQGCSLKLLDYLDGELCGWEQRLDAGETPHFGDLSQLAKTSSKVYAALEKNGLLAAITRI